MPLELLERDQPVATIMPGHGGPGGGDEAPDDETETEDEEETEGDPS